MNQNAVKKVAYNQQVLPNERAQFSIGQVGGLTTNKENNLLVFHRASRRWDRWYKQISVQNDSCYICYLLRTVDLIKVFLARL